jgi:TRAP-type C4-dicarboxylate transport system permease small subunit
VAGEPEEVDGDEAPRVPLTIERLICAAAMAALCLITFANVLTRYLTSASFAFTEEYSVALMVVMTLVGAALATARGSHVQIDFMVQRLGPVGRRRAEVGACLATAAMFAVLAGWGGYLAYDEWRFEVTSPGLGRPQWLYTACLPALSLLVAARALGRLARVARGTRPAR